MKTRKLFIDERGIALPMALLVLVTLTGLMLAMLSMSAWEPLISQNLVDTVNARAIADTGLDFAYNTLMNTTNWNTVLVGATNATCVDGAPGVALGAANTTLPGLAAVYGTFTLRVRNDCQPSDANMTGVPAEAGANFSNDTNSRLVVESTGSKNNANRTMMMVLQRINLPSLDAALAFPGVQSDVNFSGSTFTIDGRDTRLTDTVGSPTGTNAPVFAITTAGNAQGQTNASGIQTQLANNQQNDVWGKNPSGSGIVNGDAAVTPDPALTSQAVTDFVNAVKRMADVTYSADNTHSVQIQNVGSTCSANFKDPTCFGTDSKPKIVYVKGTLANANDDFKALDISGNSAGTGILIVENGHLEITGDFQWHGPIIVTGNNVGIWYKGGGQKSIYGEVIVNELRDDGSTNLEGDIRGNAKMAYSKEALDLVQNLLVRRFVQMYSVRER
jgi:Tfp pilus assembly protein PilX